MSKQQRVLTTSECSVSGEIKRYDRTEAQQAGCGRYPSMYVNRRRVPMKGCVRQIYLRQDQDQHYQQQQAHQHKQGRRFYGPTPHGTEGNTIFNGVKPHESARLLRGLIVEVRGHTRIATSDRPQHDHAGVILKMSPAMLRCRLHQQALQILRTGPAILLRDPGQALLAKRFIIRVGSLD